MKFKNSIIFLSSILLVVSFVSLYPLKEGNKNKLKKKKKKKDKGSKSNLTTATKSPSTPTATKFIQLVRRFPLYNYIPLFIRTMIENFISFIIFI